MESQSAYDDYINMLVDEEENDKIDQLLSEQYGESDSEYEGDPKDIESADSDSDIEIYLQGNKRKRPVLRQRGAKKRLTSTDSFQSTSSVETTVESPTDESTAVLSEGLINVNDGEIKPRGKIG